MPNNKVPSYSRLFAETFRLSACTFGGGFVIIPLMRKRFVQELNWIEEQEMLDMTAIAQSSPGAMAVNASVLIGYRLAGIHGALVAVLATILPPLLIISTISFLYTSFRNNVYVSMVMTGMLAGIAAVLCDVVIALTQGVFKEKRLLPIVVLAASFVAVRYLGINIVVIILMCGAVGAADTLLRERKKKGRA